MKVRYSLWRNTYHLHVLARQDVPIVIYLYEPQAGKHAELPPLPVYASGRTQQRRVKLTAVFVTVTSSQQIYAQTNCNFVLCCEQQGGDALAYAQAAELAVQGPGRAWKVWLVCGDCMLIGSVCCLLVSALSMPLLSISFNLPC